MTIAVVGAGVVGLTTALRLAQAGFPVRIVDRDPATHHASRAAGAIWYPYLAEPQELVDRWGAATLAELTRLAGQPGAPVHVPDLIELHREASPDPLFRDLLQDFRRLHPGELPEGYVDGWTFSTPLVDVPAYLDMLREQLAEHGVAIESHAGGVDSLEELEGDLVVNCAGIGAVDLVGDGYLRPVRGQTLIVTNPGVDKAWLEESDPAAPTYVFPHGEICLLGGSALVDDWDMEPRSSITQSILDRCGALVPALQGAEVLEVRVGLRPVRSRVRLLGQTLSGRPVIHNYGHGGAGYTLAWGCAGDVVEQARSILG